MDNNYLMHYRTPESKNGFRRWQYKDGSLTPEGRIHYGVGPPRVKKAVTATVNAAGSALSKAGTKASNLLGKVSEAAAKSYQSKKQVYTAKRAAKKDKKASEKEANSSTIDAAKLKTMTAAQINQETERMKAEKAYRDAFAALHPEKKGAFKQATEAGKKALSKALASAAEKKVTEFIDNVFKARTPDAIRQAKAYQEWKDKKFDPDYSPTSIKNRYSDAYLKELNRSESVKAQTKDGTYNAEKANPDYWQRENERRDAAAVKPAADKYREYQRLVQIARAAADKYAELKDGNKPSRDGPDQAKAELDRANVAAEAAKQIVEELVSSLTVSQLDQFKDVTRPLK